MRFNLRFSPRIRVLVLCAMAVLTWAGSAAARQVVVFTALDQVFSEPILKDFEARTGIRVKAVYDLEATKTTGLVNRLIAEKKSPLCDVFWNNEVIKSIVLKQKGILQPYVSPSAKDIPAAFKDSEGYWTGFAARARVLAANTRVLDADDLPGGIFQLTEPRFKNRVAIANPLFGTTATHVAALFSHLGEERAKSYFRALNANGVRILDGNSVVKDRVGAGGVWVGFTDTDDANVGVEAGLPLAKIFPDKEGMGTLLIPNTVGMVANCPNPEEACQLIDYLLSKEVEQRLAFCPSVQMPLRGDVPTPPDFVTIDRINAMNVDFEAVAEMMDTSVRFIQEEFLR